MTVAVSVQRRHRPSADDVLVFFVSRPPTPRSSINVVSRSTTDRPIDDVLVFLQAASATW